MKKSANSLIKKVLLGVAAYILHPTDVSGQQLNLGNEEPLYKAIFDCCFVNECEDKVKEETAATSRVVVEGEQKETCAVCGKPSKNVIVYARAY